MPDDTPSALQDAQDRAYRRMSAEQKLMLVCELSQTTRELAETGVRMRHPGLDEAGVKRRLFKDLYGFEYPAS